MKIYHPLAHIEGREALRVSVREASGDIMQQVLLDTPLQSSAPGLSHETRVEKFVLF